MTNLKRVTFVIGFDNQGKPMSLGFSANEFRVIYFTDDLKYIQMDNTKPDSTEVISVIYPVDRYYAIEYQEADLNVAPMSYLPTPAALRAAFEKRQAEDAQFKMKDGIDVA